MKRSAQSVIPEGWQAKTLDDVCLLLKGKGLSKDKLDPSGVNKCILYGQLFTIYREVITKVESRTNSDEGVRSQDGDILIPGSTTTRAEDLAVASALQESDVLLGGDINILRKKDEQYDPVFLSYYLTHFKKKEIGSFGQGITIVHLYGRDLKKIRVSLPPIFEQKKIAKIISIFDIGIRNTEEIITKTERFKQGLTQKFYTEGIGHARFKKIGSGAIPESWSYVLLDSVAKRGSGHTPNKQHPEYWDGGIKWVSLADSKKLDNRYIYSTDKEISTLGIDNSSAILHPKDTVILSRDAGVGKSAVLGSDMAVSQHFMAWICSEKLNNWFLYYFLQSRKKEFERIATGTTIKTIGLQYFKDLFIPLPPMEEQVRIANILFVLDDKLSVYEKIKTEQISQKKGLMQDLFSGKVRAGHV